jgi:hypothetical protein
VSYYLASRKACMIFSVRILVRVDCVVAFILFDVNNVLDRGDK